ncbi:hypothetical protein ACFXTO_013675 [Malus domestica]
MKDVREAGLVVSLQGKHESKWKKITTELSDRWWLKEDEMLVRDERDAKFTPCLEKENGRVMEARDIAQSKQDLGAKKERERREEAE